jgi:dTDP-4-dehydrorhamnose reductase
MKLLITGSNGFVAGSIIVQAPSHWEMYGISRSDPPFHTNNYIHHKLDLNNKESVNELLTEIKPDVVIHTAAIANIDFCESNPELAEKANVEITRTMAEICVKIGARLIFCSTDSVFDGEKGNYSEQDLPIPVNVYAQTKIAAEKIVLEASKKNIVARLALVIGMPVIGTGNSFLYNTIAKLKEGHTCGFPVEEIRTPIDVITLGKALLELAGADFHGIIHFAGNTCITRFEMGKEIARIAGFPTELIVTTPGDNIPGRARRAPNVCLDNTLSRNILKTPMLSISDGIYQTINYNKNPVS